MEKINKQTIKEKIADGLGLVKKMGGKDKAAHVEPEVAGRVLLPKPTLLIFSSRRRHTSSDRDWSSDVCSSDLIEFRAEARLLIEALAGSKNFNVGGSA